MNIACLLLSVIPWETAMDGWMEKQKNEPGGSLCTGESKSVLLRLQEMDARALELRLGEMQGKLDKMEEVPKMAMEEHGAKHTEEDRISKLQMDIAENIKEVKAEVNAGKRTMSW